MFRTAPFILTCAAMLTAFAAHIYAEPKPTNSGPAVTSRTGRPRSNRAAPKWSLIWADEFEGTQIDKTRWTVKNAAADYNHQMEYSVPEEVYVKGGNLIIRTRLASSWTNRKFMDKGVETGGTPRERPYTSGMVNSSGKFSFKYGKVEFKAKLPSGSGMWPALWMLPEPDGWPPEIDIAELKGREPHTIYMTSHWGTSNADHQQSHNPTYTCKEDFSKAFHLFAVDWEPQYIRWYIDGKLQAQIDHNVPDQDMYLIMNTAVGGDFDKDADGKPVAITQLLPQYMTIDYVRVYQRSDVQGDKHIVP